MSRIRVLHLIGSKGLYGAERVLLNLLPALRQSGIDVTLGCMSPLNSKGADIGKELENINVPVVFMNEKRKFSGKSLLTIYRTIKKTNTNILHVHGYKATILGGFIARILGIPQVSTYHGEARQVPELSTYVKIETYFLRRAARIVAVSKKIKEELISRGISDDKISVIHNGIKDPLETQDGQRNYGKKKPILPCLLCVGRLIKIKRFDLVIDAVKVLKKDYPKIVLSIAGEGPQDEILKKKVVDLELNDSVRFLGYVKDIKKLYQDTDIFVLPSDIEGAPIALIEAMAFSLPIIATSVGAVPDMIKSGKDAILIPPNSEKELIESLRYLLLHPEICRVLGKTAREKFLENYNSGIVAESYIKEYKKICN